MMKKRLKTDKNIGGTCMRMYDLIMKKRNGQILSRDEIDFMVQGYTTGTIPDYQMSAMMMAIYFRGLVFGESKWTNTVPEV